MATARTTLLACLLLLAPWAAQAAAEATISCTDMRSNPAIFTSEVDLGSGHGSPTKVDYHCPESLAQLPITQTVYQLSEKIRNQYPWPGCSGSIVYAQWRYYHWALLQACLAPQQLLGGKKSRTYSDKTWAYLARWALQSPSQQRLYQALRTAVDEASPALTQHYQSTAQLTPAEAAKASERALAIMLYWAGGAAPGSSDTNYNPELPGIVQTMATAPLTLEQLNQWLSQHPDAEPHTVDLALKSAIIHHQPLAVIQQLIAVSQPLDQGDESALFFALDNPPALTALLQAGADINYRNGFGKTVLSYAIERGDIAQVKQLLSAGANPNQRYLSSTELEDHAMCQYNIQHGQRTPLMHAAQHASAPMLELLLQHNADPQARDEQGWSALDYARHNQQQDNEQALLLHSTAAD